MFVDLDFDSTTLSHSPLPVSVTMAPKISPKHKRGIARKLQPAKKRAREDDPVLSGPATKKVRSAASYAEPTVSSRARSKVPVEPLASADKIQEKKSRSKSFLEILELEFQVRVLDCRSVCEVC